tara:strand:+ start:715 stop:1692 length:978 start_codon:yes stop_codon:yes gene_type:complete
MELRQPPQSSEKSSKQKATLNISLFGIVMVTLLSILALELSHYVEDTEASQGLLQVAAQLKSSGLLEESSELYEKYLEKSTMHPDFPATAFALAENYIQQGQFEKALAWLYRAERKAEANLKNKIAKKIVYSLERLGKVQAANTALESRTSMNPEKMQRSETDKVLARIGDEEIYQSDLEQAVSNLPPAMAKNLSSSPENKQLLLKQMIADRLLAKKARKLEMHKSSEYTRKVEQLSQQILITDYMEKEIFQKLKPKEIDLENHYNAHLQRYTPKGSEEPLAFEKIKERVMNDYKQAALGTAVQEMLEAEIATKDVQLFMENLNN